MSRPDEFGDYLERHPGTVYVDAYYADLSGIVRGKRLPVDLAGKLFSDGMGVPGSVHLLSVSGDSCDPEGIGFSDGDPDQLAFPIAGTLHPVPWAEQPTAQVMMTFRHTDGAPYYYEPRNVLRRAAEPLAALGLTPVIAFELEFYLVDPERLPDGSPRAARSPGSGAPQTATQVYGFNELDEFARFLAAIDAACAAQNIPSQAISSEYAPGQFEINLHHVADPLRAADDCVAFKRAVQSIARQHAMQATFMAKPFLEHSGSGLHLHISLLDGEGNNVFAQPGSTPDAPAISDTMRHALGGILQTLPETTALLAPNRNSFRRFQPNIYVPVNATWGFENRSVALRIPGGAENARRLEHRVAGADANPYLVLAATLAAMHHGITEQIDCGPPSHGNVSGDVDPDMPLRPRPALARLADSDVLNRYLGADYLRAYCACKAGELDAFENLITPAEYQWYLLT